MSIELHGSLAQEPSVLIDTTVQEKNITYPTDAKLAIKIINRLNKLAKHQYQFSSIARNIRRVVWIATEVLVIRVVLKLQHNTLVREVLQLFKHEQAHHQPIFFIQSFSPN
jgi:hypothetical protein